MSARFVPAAIAPPPEPVDVEDVIPSPIAGADRLRGTPPGPTKRCVPDGTEPETAIRSCWSPEPTPVRSAVGVNVWCALLLIVVVAPATITFELPLRAIFDSVSVGPPGVAESV